MGLTNLPSGQAQQTFPIVTFAGTNAPTNWGGTTANRTIAENYTLLDNVQWVRGKHAFTFGGQIAWILYQTLPATGGATPLTLANAVTETSALNKSSNASPSYAATSNTGVAYASFLVGQIDKASLTQYLVQEFGARFRAMSPYIQDNWKVTPKLTLDIGLRYDFFPTFREVHNNMTFFNPNLANPITGGNGALQYTGTGANSCNCTSPANNFIKNIGPRLGLAYQVDPKTVVRASYGVMYTHGNAVGGGAASSTGTGTLGFSSGLSAGPNGQLLSTAPLTGANTDIPTFAPAAGRDSGPAFGTGYTTVKGYTGSPLSVGYADPYLGGRAPQYINWSFGFQHSWTDAITSTISYVGSQGHFLPADGSNARGYWANQLDPKYLSLGSSLSLTGANLTAACVANNLPCPANFTPSQSLATALKPFPFYSRGRHVRFRGELQLSRAPDAGEYASGAWPDLHGQLHLVAFDRRWRHLPFRLRHSGGLLRQRQGLEAGCHRAQRLHQQPASPSRRHRRLGSACRQDVPCQQCLAARDLRRLQAL